MRAAAPTLPGMDLRTVIPWLLGMERPPAPPVGETADFVDTTVTVYERRREEGGEAPIWFADWQEA